MAHPVRAEAGHTSAEIAHAVHVLGAADLDTLDAVVGSSDFSATDRQLLGTVRSLLAHQRAAVALERVLETLPATVDPATARAAQATENVWRQIEQEFGLLASGEVGALLGARNANRAYAADRRKRGELLAVHRRNAYLYPGFQFDRERGRVRDGVAPLLALAGEHQRTPESVIMWLVSPSTYFGGDRPVDHLDDGSRVLDVAGRAWDVRW